MNLQHYIFGRRTPEFKAPHLLVAEHLILKISSKYEPFFVAYIICQIIRKINYCFSFLLAIFFAGKNPAYCSKPE